MSHSPHLGTDAAISAPSPSPWHILSHGTNVTLQHSPTPTQRTWGNLQIQSCKPSCIPKASLPQGSQQGKTWAEENYTRLKQLHGHTVAVLSRRVFRCMRGLHLLHVSSRQEESHDQRGPQLPTTHRSIFLVAASVVQHNSRGPAQHVRLQRVCGERPSDLLGHTNHPARR